MQTRSHTTFASAIALVSLGTTAWADGLTLPVVEAPVEIRSPAVVSKSWTGFSAGVQLGYTYVDGDGGRDGDNVNFGAHVGYDYDFGSYVLGAELDYDNTDIELDNTSSDIDSITRLKFRAGYDLGDTLVYATAGVASADTTGSDEIGGVVGLGVAYRVTESYTLGGELLAHRFNDIDGNTGADGNVITLNIRATYRF